MKNIKKIVVATNNAGKAREIGELLGSAPHDGAEVVSLAEVLGYKANIEENGATFKENALIKAREARRLPKELWGDTCSFMCVADDSGLCVDCLFGAPGVYSARYAGYSATDADNVEKLLREIALITPSALVPTLPTARFVCSIVAILGDGTEVWAEGTCEGGITNRKAGSNGFGYDPVFFLPDYGCTMAELDSAAKNKISHRGKAVRQLTKILLI